jgi:hypothetical protein
MVVSRRSPGPTVGGRGVSSLSEEQLERKRTKDREARRLHRRHMKEYIGNLEQQVAELSKEKDEVLQLNSQLQTRVAAL